MLMTCVSCAACAVHTISARSIFNSWIMAIGMLLFGNGTFITIFFTSLIQLIATVCSIDAFPFPRCFPTDRFGSVRFGLLERPFLCLFLFFACSLWALNFIFTIFAQPAHTHARRD